jgi:NAD(P)H-hydrate epimerase
VSNLLALPPRPEDGHKGTFGTVGIVGGQDNTDTTMVGAPALAARAALRIGCGRVMIASPRSIMSEVLGECLSATGRPLPQDGRGELESRGTVLAVASLDAETDAMAVGPGLGQSLGAVAVVSSLLSAEGPPLVLDADAIHIVAGPDAVGGWSRHVVLTPHPGEFRVLAEAMGLATPGSDDDSRREAAIAMSDRLNAVIVLKGHGTVVASGSDVWTSDEGGVELAIPGSGDVLTGVLAGILAQLAQSDEAVDVAAAARLAVTTHARAGACWRRERGTRGLLAEELADRIGLCP